MNNTSLCNIKILFFLRGGKKNHIRVSQLFIKCDGYIYYNVMTIIIMLEKQNDYIDDFGSMKKGWGDEIHQLLYPNQLRQFIKYPHYANFSSTIELSQIKFVIYTLTDARLF